jgi:hypothetical protein
MSSGFFYAHATKKNQVSWPGFFYLIIHFFTTNQRKKVWGSIRWAVDRGLSAVDDYPQF